MKSQTDCSGLSELMDEARSMLEVGAYNENIVNLQGVTLKIDHERITQVEIALGFYL